MSAIIMWLLYSVIVVYQFLDAWQTVLFLKMGAIEINPIMASMIEHAGLESIFVVKFFVCFFLGFLLFIYQKQWGTR